MSARTSPPARLLILGAALLIGTAISTCLLPEVVAALFALVAVSVLDRAGLLTLSPALGRRQEAIQ